VPTLVLVEHPRRALDDHVADLVGGDATSLSAAQAVPRSRRTRPDLPSSSPGEQHPVDIGAVVAG
jgi:hypothetical protein